MTTRIKTRAKLDDPLSGDTPQTTINLEKNDVSSGPGSFGISHKIQKNQENESIKNFTLCLQSYRDGILLLITNLPDKVWKTNNISVNLKDEVNSIYEDYINKLKGKAFGQQKQLFYTFLSEYIDLLEQHTTLNNPADTLITAQRYAVRENGTGPVKTTVEAEDLFSPDPEKNITYILQNAEPITDENLQSRLCQEIQENIRPWAKNLEDWEREVIKNHNKQSDSRQHILPSSLRHIPGLANSFLHCLTINKKEEQSIKLIEFFRHATQVPISLFKVKKLEIEKELFSITCENIASQIRLSLEHREKNLVKTNELVILIQSIISPGRAATIKSKFFTDKSDNDTLIYDTKEKAIEIFQAALAHPTKEITDQNIISTFFTPFEQNTQPYTYANLLEKFAIISPKNENISQSPKITLVSTNHPYNILRYIGTYPKQTTRNQFNTTKLFGCIGRYLQAYVSNEISNGGTNQNPELNKKLLAELSILFQEAKDISIFAEKKIQIENKLKEIKEKDLRVEDKNILRLLDAFQAYLTIPPGQGSILQEDKQHRQSMLSALEVIIVHCLQGTSWVACKSGKDRTGGAAAAIDAMLLFYEEHNRFPCFDDGQKERTHYLNIWDKLLQSGHHQNIASCNSPGAKGLVNGAGFLPGDMRRNQDRQKEETQFARLNKPNVKNIYKNLNKKIKNFINLFIKKLIYLKKNITNLFYDKELTVKEMPSKGQETIKEFVEKLQPLKINDIKTVEFDKGSGQNSEYLTYSIGSLRFFYLRQKNTSQNTVQKKEAEKIESILSPLNA